MSTEREAGREEPKKRGAKSQYAEEMFERVRARVAEGMPVPTAIQAAGMCVSQFYAAVADHPEWKVALQQARLERRVGRLEDESCRRVFIGDSRLVFWKGEQVGEIREPAIGMLIFMLKTLAPEKYANTKAAAKRRAQLDGLEASRARVLANAQRGVKIMQGHYREYLQRCGVPVPPGKAPPCTHGASGAEDAAAGQKGNLTLDHDLDHDLDHNLDLVPSGEATPGGAEDTETGRHGDAGTGQGNSDQLSVNSDQSSVSKAPPCTHGASGAEDTETGQGNSEQLSGNDKERGKSDQSSANIEWDVLDFDQFSADVAARSSTAASKAPPCTHGAFGAGDTETGQRGRGQKAANSGQSSREDTESKAPPCTPVKTPEYAESGGQSRAQITGNKTIARQENMAAGLRGSEQLPVTSKQLSVISYQLPVNSYQ